MKRLFAAGFFAFALSLAGGAAVFAHEPGLLATTNGTDEQGQVGQSDKADNQSGTDEQGQVGESDKADNQSGTDEQGQVGESDKADHQSGTDEQGTAGQATH